MKTLFTLFIVVSSVSLASTFLERHKSAYSYAKSCAAGLCFADREARDFAKAVASGDISGDFLPAFKNAYAYAYAYAKSCAAGMCLGPQEAQKFALEATLIEIRTTSRRYEELPEF